MKDYGIAIIENSHLPAETHIRVYVDKENKIAHMLDLDEPKSASLTNAINEKFVKKVGKKIKQKLEDYEIWLYGTDGVISAYKNRVFLHLPDNKLMMPNEFLVEMKHRRKQY